MLQFNIVVRWKVRGDPEVYYRYKDRSDLYTIQKVMQLPYKGRFKHGFLTITYQPHALGHSKHNQKFREHISSVRKLETLTLTNIH